MILGQIVGWLHLDQLNGRAVVDILVLAVVIYQLLRLIQGTRAVQILLGILSLAVVYFLTGPDHLLELPAVHRVLGWTLVIIPFAVVLLFQNHIRRVLTSFGSNPLRKLGRPHEGPERLADTVAVAAHALAARRHGALIVIEREQGLRSFAETGIAIDALAGYDLLMTIFIPGSPLHDGAVIIVEERIRACCCFLPLSSTPRSAHSFGSRHRAALGISEETDAVAVVVSEERGTISIAHDGEILEDLGPHELHETLRSLLAPDRPLLARLAGRPRQAPLEGDGEGEGEAGQPGPVAPPAERAPSGERT